MTNMMTEIEAIDILNRFHCMHIDVARRQAIDVAIKSIEKQIPKKPIERIKMIGLDKGGKCPACQKYINNHNHWLYCECGQKLDWE